MSSTSTKAVIDQLLNSPDIHWNLSAVDLADRCVAEDGCLRADTGAVVAYSGRYSGRIPKDKFIVRDAETTDVVWWGNTAPIEPSKSFGILEKAARYLDGQTLYVVDAFAGADAGYQLKVRFVLERAYHALFISQLLITPSEAQLQDFQPDWVVLDAGRFHVEPSADGVRTDAAIVLDFTSKSVVIAGTEYAGEIKKSIFTVMNYLLPRQRVMSMHCSANRGSDGDVALFFGLSGTGKTSLSADPKRELIGDDEHGWSDAGVFNIEGGCYAKCVNLSREREPEIWDAIREGTVLENVVLDDTGHADYVDQSITENTRAAYPLEFIPNALIPSVAGHPKNIVFLTCDALGLLPPLARLSPEQVRFYFLNGYTAKVAGTEAGVTEPTLTFSACFGQPFLPLEPKVYADLLLEKIASHRAKVWLINTGWTGGGFGIGHRIAIEHTRAMLDAVLEDRLDSIPYRVDDVFGLASPASCPNVPPELLDPRSQWLDRGQYDAKAQELQRLFEQNALKYLIADK